MSRKDRDIAEWVDDVLEKDIEDDFFGKDDQDSNESNNSTESDRLLLAAYELTEIERFCKEVVENVIDTATQTCQLRLIKHVVEDSENAEDYTIEVDDGKIRYEVMWVDGACYEKDGWY